MTTGGSKSDGFTIVETLIVLAVSALVAASTMLLINGRQNKTQFMVASNNIKQRIEQIINETRSGFYPGDVDFSCTGATNGAHPQITFSLTPKGQGSNDGCTFVGKAIEFGVGKAQANPEVYATFPLVGNQQFYDATISAKRDVQKYSEASPIALAPNSLNIPAGVDHSDFSKTQNGLSFKRATFKLNSSTVSVANYAVFAFADSLGDYQLNASTGDLNSATEKLNMYYFSTVAAKTPMWGIPPTTKFDVVDGINNRGVYDLTGAAELKSVDLCFDSGGTNQSAVITITGLGQLSVTLKINNSSCP